MSPRTHRSPPREGQWARTLLLAASILTIVASYTLVKAVRDAVFLAKFGMTSQAFLYIALAATAGAFAAVATKVSHGLQGTRLIVGTHAVVATSLLLLWGALEAHVPGMAWVLYIWSSFFGLFVIANFWLLANQLYDTRTAKRVFPLLGAGAILGGAVGGQTAELATSIGALNLMPIIAGGFLLSALLAVAAWHRRDPTQTPAYQPPVNEDGEPEPPRFSEAFRLILRHRYLLLIAGLLLLATITTTLIELQVKGIAKEHFGSNRDEMTAFFGRLLKTLSLVSLGIQLFVTAPFLRRFGVGRALFVLPTTLAVGVGAIALHAILGIPPILAVSLAKVGDGGLRFSLDKAAMELLYMPVPTAVKSRAKPVIDTVGDRAGTASSGVIWLVLTFVSGAGITGLVVLASLTTIVILAIWLVLIVRTRREYVHAFRVALPGPAPDAHAIPIDLREERQRVALEHALTAGDPRAVVVALDALAASHQAGAWPERRQLAVLTDHPSADVSARAFDLLGDLGDGSQHLRAQRATSHASPEVRAAAVRYLASTAPHGVEELLESADPRARLGALAFLARRGPVEAARASGRLAELLAGPLAEEPSFRRELAVALSALPVIEARPFLERLLYDEDPEVAEAAGVSAASVNERGSLRGLLEALDDAGPRRASALGALRGLGPAVVRELAAALDDPSLPHETRQRIPSILGSTGTQEAADALLGRLAAREGEERSHFVGALARLRRQSAVRLDHAAIENAIHDEAQRYATHLSALAREEALENDGPHVHAPGAVLLRRALGEKVEDELERIFRPIGLAYPEEQVLAAYYGLRREEATMRASALEFLENILENPLRHELISLLEGETAMTALGLSRLRRRRVVVPTRRDTLRALTRDPDPWLRALAVYVIGEAGLIELADAVSPHADDEEDPEVRQARLLARQRLADLWPARFRHPYPTEDHPDARDD